MTTNTAERGNERWNVLSPTFEEWAETQRESPFRLELDLSVQTIDGIHSYANPETQRFYSAFFNGFLEGETEAFRAHVMRISS